jgi:hypothetical protein
MKEKSVRVHLSDHQRQIIRKKVTENPSLLPNWVKGSFTMTKIVFFAYA